MYQEYFAFADDLTQNPIKPIGMYLLDDDFVDLIQTSFPGIKLEDLLKDRDVLAAFAGEDRVDHASDIIKAAIDYEQSNDSKDTSYVPPQDY